MSETQTHCQTLSYEPVGANCVGGKIGGPGEECAVPSPPAALLPVPKQRDSLLRH